MCGPPLAEDERMPFQLNWQQAPVPPELATRRVPQRSMSSPAQRRDCPCSSLAEAARARHVRTFGVDRTRQNAEL